MHVRAIDTFHICVYTVVGTVYNTCIQVHLYFDIRSLIMYVCMYVCCLSIFSYLRMYLGTVHA